MSVIECFETDGGVNYRSDWLIFFNLCGFRLMLQATCTPEGEGAWIGRESERLKHGAEVCVCTPT